MRKVSYSPLFRCLVCLILVCCILVNLSPIRAEALDPMTWVWLEASMVFASIMAGLGVSPVDELAAGFRETCDDCWNFISLNYDFVTDDEKIAVWSTGTDELPFMIDQELVEAVREWLFTSETVVEESVESGMAYYNNWYLPVLKDEGDSWPYITILYYSSSEYFQVCYSASQPVVHLHTDLSGSRNQLIFSGNYVVYKCLDPFTNWSSRVIKSSSVMPNADFCFWSNFDLYHEDGTLVLAASEPSNSVVISADDEKFLTNYVAPSSEDFTTGYSSWSAGAISVPGIRSKEEEREVVVPLSIPGTAADVYSFAQTDVWTGANTAADVIAQAVPITGTGTLDPSVPVVPEVPAEVAPYTFSLNDIFPFCIPFDLYDFLTCLDATPVAPVINWQIQLPGGSTYPLTVDLSAFDSVAQLLRRLELLVFSIALAIKTRDLIKG